MSKKKVENTVTEEPKIPPVEASNTIIEQEKSLVGLNGFDMSDYLAKPCENPIILKRELVTVPVRRPGDQVFFRIHPTEEAPVYLVHWKDDNEMYLVNQKIAPVLAEQPKLYILYLGMMLNGNVFLYPIQQKGPEETKWNSWHQSSYAIVQMAKKKWVRAVAERAINGYTPIVALSNLAEPEWPEKSLVEIISIAFRENRIDSENHPLIKQLKGL